MSDIKLFKIKNKAATELHGKAAALERDLAQLIDQNLEPLLGISFVKSEHSTGKVHGGRIDTLGLDENFCPVILEYKRNQNENVINQGLFYLDWLMDHKADFKLLVIEKLGMKMAEQIEWGSPRLICIAEDFSKYDEHAVKQMNHNIELMRYRHFGEDLLLLELVNATSSTGNRYSEKEFTAQPEKKTSSQTYNTPLQSLEKCSDEVKQRYQVLEDYLLSLGDDVQKKTLKWYIAFKKIRNFACVDFGSQKEEICLWLKLNPDDLDLEEGFTRDVRKVGHLGTGDLEVKIYTDEDLQKAKTLIQKSFEES